MALLRAALRTAALRSRLPASGVTAGRALRFGSGMGGGPVGYGSGPYRGLKIPKVAQWHKNIQVFYGTVLWLWLFYRIKEDGAWVFFGVHPWHGHDDHGDHDDHGEEEH